MTPHYCLALLHPLPLPIHQAAIKQLQAGVGGVGKPPPKLILNSYLFTEESSHTFISLVTVSHFIFNNKYQLIFIHLILAALK